MFIKKYLDYQNYGKAIGKVIYEFNKDIIDVVCDYVPAVKPQIAYYEAYGVEGVIAFYKTVQYGKSKGMVVIEDGKRNDIGSTAQAYANGHIGFSDDLNGKKIKGFDVDFLTVNPYLGNDGVEPFIDVCCENSKGIFVLVKTSNPSSGDFQDQIMDGGKHLYELVAEYVKEKSNFNVGKYGFSSIGAVVGATYPEQAEVLRAIMDKSYFLVPGYGQQGGTAKDIVPCFHENGLGAIINSSRGILYSYLKKYSVQEITKKQFKIEIKNAVTEMKNDIVEELRKSYKKLLY